MNTLRLESCDGKMCTKCDMPYIVMNYITPLMQCVTNDIREYNMQLLTTKCLNTAVMLVFFMFGRQGLKHASYCDSHNVISRHTNGTDTNKDVVARMKKTILSRNMKYRYMYYILLNDNYFPMPQDATRKKYFPGHVFILEKVPTSGGPYFNLYQSYINQYDLKGWYEKNNKTLRFSRSQVKMLLDKLAYILNNDVWDDACVRYWMDFTRVDTSDLIGSSQKGQLFICMSAAKVSTCVENIQSYASTKLQEIAGKDSAALYGKQEYYVNAQVDPLTYGDVKHNLEKILQDIQANKNTL